MTVKEIAEAVGKTDRGVRKWVAKASEKRSVIAEKSSVSSPMKPADYTLDETCTIIEAGMGKNAAGIFRANASRTGYIESTAIHEHPGEIAIIVRETVTAMVPAIIAAIKGALPENAVAALPAPAVKSERDLLRQVVNVYVKNSGTSHAQTWNDLYSEYYYRYHRNLKTSARNRGMSIIEYAEVEGLVSDLLALAVDMFGAAA